MKASEVVDAKKKVMGAADATAMLKGIEQVYVAKGKKVVHFDMRKTKAEEAVPLMLGPTGNVRAPLLRKGKVLIVGFEEGMYREVLG
jgi:hypothetical protein